MSYFIKKCAECGAENNPAEHDCGQCGKPLPAVKTESPHKPPPARQSLSQAESTKSAAVHAANLSGETVIVDVKIRFWSMVVILVKLAFASIPAVLIVVGILLFIASVLDVGTLFMQHLGVILGSK